VPCGIALLRTPRAHTAKHMVLLMLSGPNIHVMRRLLMQRPYERHRAHALAREECRKCHSARIATRTCFDLSSTQHISFLNPPSSLPLSPMSTRRPAEDAANGQSDPKRAKIDPPKPAFDIASIRAQIAAKKAALEAANNGSASPRSAAASPAPTAAPAPSASGPAGPASLPPAPKMDQSVAERLAAVKARIEAQNARSSNPYLSGSGSMPKPAPAAAAPPVPAPLTNSSIALHPLLMASQQTQGKEEKNEKRRERDRYKPMAPKFSTVKANAAVAAEAAPPPIAIAPAPSLNPYAASSSSGAGPAGGRIQTRKPKQFQFSQPGRYVRQGDALRNEEKMEALRQRIAEASRKAGLDSEFDTLERSLKVGRVPIRSDQADPQRQPPPEVEWWDKALLPEGDTYDNIERAVEWMTTSDDSLITHLVQHPIPIAAPSDRKQGERGLMLTKKEQKKMRRQRRKAELEDKQDRQKMGLIPPDPPKVRLANLMKVLTSDAVQDPTKVEAKVRREVAQRANKHEQDNQDRKLTAEQRKQKEYDQLVARERKGIFAAAFK